MLFSNIVGLDAVKDSLIKSVKNKHIAHAQMFLGTEGSANMAMALAYATYVNCENKQEKDSCGSCPSCVKIDKLIHPDLQFVMPSYSLGSGDKDKQRAERLTSWRTFLLENPFSSLPDWANFTEAENKQCIISVDESRSIVKNISLKAFEGEYKIVLLWLPEMMNQSAANSILKILEEPPAKTLFLLVSNDLEKNIATIISRTQIVTLPTYQANEVIETLTSRFGIAEEIAQQAAQLEPNNVNEALKLCSGEESDINATFQNWMRLCFSRNLTEIVAMADDFQKMNKTTQKGLFQFGINVTRNLLLHQSDSKQLLRLKESERVFVEGFAKVITMDKLMAFSSSLNTAFFHLERNANPKIIFLDLSLNIATLLKA